MEKQERGEWIICVTMRERGLTEGQTDEIMIGMHVGVLWEGHTKVFMPRDKPRLTTCHRACDTPFI